MTGKVWLVGAGPGDAGLMTLRGKEVLSQADVVVFAPDWAKARGCRIERECAKIYHIPTSRIKG